MAFATTAAAAVAERNKVPSNTQILSSLHTDYVHHVAFDTYGRRMVSCSGDRFVRIWDLTSEGNWVLSSEWQAHRGSISQVSWAHPEFGSILATAGSDHNVVLWEERDGHKWASVVTLTEARRAVQCVEFAPKHLRLLLAAGSADGTVRLYEALDVRNLAQWPLQASLQAFPSDAGSLGVTCVSWCSGPMGAPTLVVGGSHLVVYRRTKQWQAILTIPKVSNMGVLDVAWAPNVGRRFHWIAATHGSELRVHKLSREASKSDSLELESTQVLGEDGEMSSSTANQMWKCQWNVTGTVLASSGDAGIVQLWKSDFQGQWKCVSEIHGDLTSANANR
jgi:nucleoporin SEH1